MTSGQLARDTNACFFTIQIIFWALTWLVWWIDLSLLVATALQWWCFSGRCSFLEWQGMDDISSTLVRYCGIKRFCLSRSFSLNHFRHQSFSSLMVYWICDFYPDTVCGCHRSWAFYLLSSMLDKVVRFLLRIRSVNVIKLIYSFAF